MISNSFFLFLSVRYSVNNTHALLVQRKSFVVFSPPPQNYMYPKNINTEEIEYSNIHIFVWRLHARQIGVRNACTGIYWPLMISVITCVKLPGCIFHHKKYVCECLSEAI